MLKYSLRENLLTAEAGSGTKATGTVERRFFMKIVCMMRKWKWIVAPILAAGVLLCASGCSESADENDGDKTSTDKTNDDGDNFVEYTVGTIVEFENKNYLVIKNTEHSEKTAVEQSLAAEYGYYPNSRADAYRYGLLNKRNITAYVELFDISTKKNLDDTSITTWEDTYLIVCSGQKHFRIRQRWEKSKITDFVTLTESDLRKNYDPSRFVVDNYKAYYGADLGKKIFESYAFKYESDRKTVYYRYENQMEAQSYKNYVSINGSEKNIYATRMYRSGSEQQWWQLRNPLDSFFFQFCVRPESYQLETRGDGMIDGSTSSSVYKSTLTINRLTYNSDSGTFDIQFSVDTREKDVSVFRETFTISEPGFQNEYVSVSSKMQAVLNGGRVPAEIQFFVPFKNPDVPLSSYAQITFVPKAEGGTVVYVPKASAEYTYDFIARFASNYQRLFDFSSIPLSPDVILRNDDDAAADTETPHFTFTGGTLRIELESMVNNFDIANDASASGGKSGKLVSEESFAEAVVTFPAGNYTGFAVMRAPSGDNDAFNVKFGDDYVRVYADDPVPAGYASASRTPIHLSCAEEVTVRMIILKDNPYRPDRPGETGMFIDYLEFKKN